jgi:hypothetical protein
MFESVGIVAPLVARELADGSLQLVDGHLRAGIDSDAQVPVTIVELDDAETERVLTTLDPIASMAEADREILKGLLDSFATHDDDIETLLARIKNEYLPPIVAAGDSAMMPGAEDAWNTAAEGAFSGVRMVQLYFDEAAREEFGKMEEALREVYGTDNVTDTVLCALRQVTTRE